MADFIYPLGISFKDWASQIRVNLPFMDFPNPEKEDEWWDWAAQVINLNSLNQVPVPDKTTYPKPEDWREWAKFFIGSVNNTT